MPKKQWPKLGRFILIYFKKIFFQSKSQGSRPLKIFEATLKLNILSKTGPQNRIFLVNYKKLGMKTSRISRVL